MNQISWDQNFNFVRSIAHLEANQTLDEQGKGTMRSPGVIWGKWIVFKILSLFGLPQCLGLKMNGNLDAGTQKVIDATAELLKPEHLRHLNLENYNSIDASLKELQIVMKRDGGSLDREVNEIVTSLQTFKTAAAITTSRQEFLNGVLNGTISDEKAFIKQMNLFYPELESDSESDEVVRILFSALGVYRMFKGDYGAFVYGQADADKMSQEQFKTKQEVVQSRYRTGDELDVFFTSLAIHHFDQLGTLSSFKRQEKEIQERLLCVRENADLFARILQFEVGSVSTNRAAQLYIKDSETFCLLNDRDYFHLYAARLIRSSIQSDSNDNAQDLIVSSTAMNSKVHDNFSIVTTLIKLQTENHGLNAYYHIIQLMAKQLGLQELSAVSFGILRLCAMYHHFNRESFGFVLNRVEELKSVNEAAYYSLLMYLTTLLDCKYSPQIIIDHASDLLRNLTEGEEGQEKEKAFLIGLRILGQLYSIIKQHVDRLKFTSDVQEFMIDIREIAKLKAGRKLSETNLEKCLLRPVVEGNLYEIRVDFDSRTATIKLLAD